MSDWSLTADPNYTPKNLATIDEIADSFPLDVRKKIKIMPQIVWQHKKDINAIGVEMSKKLIVFSDKGYDVKKVFLPTASAVSCYVESMFQFVVNYYLPVMECVCKKKLKIKFRNVLRTRYMIL